ncbi:MAG TPA: hypothetical protein VEN81_03305, partial [Planctomycetota bacterium]|nr:hypothetical protein [Planctomycetota bacterium]
MKRALGILLILGGAILNYLWLGRTLFAARELMGSTFDAGLPLRALEREYPTDVLLFLGTVWAFILGIALVLAPEEGMRGGRVARAMLLNSLMLLSSLFVGYIGGKSHAEGNLVAVFGVVALAQCALGFFLLIFA